METIFWVIGAELTPYLLIRFARILSFKNVASGVPYSEIIADRVREYLADLPHVEEKRMMGGLVFMLKGKMCVGVMHDELLCRTNPELHDTLVEESGCRPLDNSGKSMKGFILIESDALRSGRDFRRWMELALEFNPKAKASKKK